MQICEVFAFEGRGDFGDYISKIDFKAVHDTCNLTIASSSSDHLVGVRPRRLMIINIVSQREERGNMWVRWLLFSEKNFGIGFHLITKEGGGGEKFRQI